MKAPEEFLKHFPQFKEYLKVGADNCFNPFNAQLYKTHLFLKKSITNSLEKLRYDQREVKNLEKLQDWDSPLVENEDLAYNTETDDEDLTDEKWAKEEAALMKSRLMHFIPLQMFEHHEEFVVQPKEEWLYIYHKADEKEME